MYLELPNHIINAIAWTVIHSIWQVSIIALVMSVLLQNTPIRNARKRYNIGLASLLAIAITSGITFLLYVLASDPEVAQSAQLIFLSDTSISESAGSLGWIDSIYGYLNQNGALITQLWIIGAIIFGAKFVLGYLYIQYLNYQPALTANRALEKMLSAVMDKMQVATSVLIAETGKITTPIVTGYLKPIILFPLGMINQLDQQEVEIIIAHELAHIQRNDWLVNMIQSLFEIIFYYHPGVWWISTHIREERENCCDDIALLHGYDHLSYAKVLVKLKELQLQHMPGLALSLFNSKNSLMNRIKRLLGQPHNRNTFKEKAVAIALVFTVAIAFAGTRITKETFNIPFLENSNPYFIEDDIISIENPVKFVYQQDTVPKKKDRSAFMLKNSDGKSYNIESENGKITSLKVDGKVIPPEQYDEYVDQIQGDETWKFNFNGDQSFDIFRFDSMPAFDFNFDFDHEMMGEKWEEGLRHLSERLKNMDFSYLEDMELQKWEGKEEFREKMERFKKQMEELNLDNMEHLKGLEELHEMEELQRLEEMEHLKGLEGLEKLRELEGFGEMFENFNFEFPEWDIENRHFGGNANDQIARELNEDGLIKIGENNEIELTGKHLKINGEKQPSNIWEKYKGIFEEYTGMKLTKDSKVKFDIIGKESRRGIRRI